MSWTATLGLASYRLAGLAALPLAKRKLRQRAAIGKEDPHRLGERMGYPSEPRPPGALVWVHGASVGESLAGLVLVDGLATRYPAFSYLITSGTVSSANVLSARLPETATHQYVPLDLPSVVDRFLDHWQPDAALMLESEFWPNLLRGLDRRSIPHALVNGRISPKSYERWTTLRPVMSRLLSGFSVCLVQNERDARYLSDLGAPRIGVTGNLKEAAAPLEASDDQVAALISQVGDRPRWLAASTHAGEEEIVAAAHLSLSRTREGLITFIAPRHPERGPEILRAIERAGLRGKLRSRGETPGPGCDIYVCDTIGEMGLWYHACDIVFMGKSLIGIGGQNPLEPAQLGSAIVFGPNMSNFEPLATGLVEAGGAHRVLDVEMLIDVVGSLLDSPERCEVAAKAALSFATQRSGALEKTLHALRPILTALGAEAKVSDTPATRDC